MRLIFFFLFCICTLTSTNVNSQNKVPIGAWRSFLPYNRTVGISGNSNLLYVASEYGFFTHDILTGEQNLFSKSNGMSDVQMSCIGYDELNEMVILGYTNSNIDLYYDNNFYNIPYLKLKNIAGDKSIYNIYTNEGMAYLSTGIGVLVLNLNKKEVKETYVFNVKGSVASVYGFSSDDQYFYTASSAGLFKTKKSNPNIQASTSWQKLDSTRNFKQIASIQNKSIVSTADTVFALEADTLRYLLTRPLLSITHIDKKNNNDGFILSATSSIYGFSKLYFIDSNLILTDSLSTPGPKQALIANDNNVWYADAYEGLKKGNDKLSPNSPFSASTFDIIPQNGKVYVAHGAYVEKWDARSVRDGLSILDNGKWSIYNTYTFGPFNNLIDAVRMAIDPKDGTLYIASLLEGLFYLKKDNTGGQIKDGVIEPHLLDPGSYRVSGVAFDQNQNLWISNHNAAHELMARSAQDGSWYKFALPLVRPRPVYTNAAAGLMIDENNLKWFFSPGGGGVLVYDDKGTLENPSDDEYTQLVSGKGMGNLPDNNVNCIVNDKKGTIWIGTFNGIGIINCPENVISKTCEAEIRVVQYDNFAGELFAGENVKTIAVDGANRKWVGTGNGLWLISEDAGKIINRFTIDNSPLPSNNIQVIKIDPISGEVFVGTDKGMVSYRGTATEGKETNKEVLIFPNPVSKNYNGTIAINGLVANADVRITDISGQLIYRTKALGGQAIWNGKDYTGRKPQSGVFLIFATNNLGTEKYVGKLVFIN